MPSKKRKYNARFPAGRIKKIMQTDEEVGKVAQAVPIIIFDPTPRTLELFVESLLSKAKQVTLARNAKTLSPSHVKQCILAESRFDFLRDLRCLLPTPRSLELFVGSLLSKAKQVTLARNAKTLSPSQVNFLRELVKNIPDVSAAEEKEMMSAESSPNSSRFSDASVPPRRVVREDSNSSSSCDIRVPQPPPNPLKRALSADTDLPHKAQRTETQTSAALADTAIDLTKRHVEEKPVRTANFYQETLLTDDVPHRTVITVNPTYSSPQPSTSYTSMTPVEPLQRLEIPVPNPEYAEPTPPPKTPATPILNIDFSKNLTKPEIRVLDTAIASIVGVPAKAPKVQRQNSKQHKPETKKIEVKQTVSQPVDLDHLNSGNLQIDEDYDT